MIVEREDNSVLYFIVGGLLVAVMAFAFFYFQGTGNGGSSPDTLVERNNTFVEHTTEPAAGDSDTKSMSLSVGDEGASATTSTESTQ